MLSQGKSPRARFIRAALHCRRARGHGPRAAVFRRWAVLALCLAAGPGVRLGLPAGRAWRLRQNRPAPRRAETAIPLVRYSQLLGAASNRRPIEIKTRSLSSIPPLGRRGPPRAISIPSRRPSAARSADCRHAFTEQARCTPPSSPREALRAGHDLIIAVGGDGHLQRGGQRLLRARASRASPAAAHPARRGPGGAARRGTGGRPAPQPAARQTHLQRSAAPASRARRALGRRRAAATFRRRRGQGQLAASFIKRRRGGRGARRWCRSPTDSSKVLGGKITFMLASAARAPWRAGKDLKVKVSFDGEPAEDLEVTTIARRQRPLSSAAA